MAYRIKTVRYQNSDCKILLQNENGPCPLLAAANALLLKKAISLPTESIRSGVASIDDVVNVLAEKALTSTSKQAAGDHHHIDELMNIFPKLQYGMDVNPKFTQGVTGVEYTSNLTAFDLLSVDLVHGWLLDPQDRETTALIGQKTYNELIELVVQGNEASSEVQVLGKEIDELEKKLDDELNKEEEEWVNVKSEQVNNVEEVVEGDATMDGAEEDSTTPVGSDASGSSGETAAAVASATTEPTTTDGTTGGTSVNIEEDVKTIEKVLEVSDSSPTVATSDETCTEISSDEKQEANEASSDNTSDISLPLDERKSKLQTQLTSQEANEASSDNTSDISLPLDERKSKLQTQLTSLKEKREKLSTIATNGNLIHAFLSATGHQLTHYGLHELYEYLQEKSLCVFFRNNHFGTLTKHKGVLYLLVTDLGYANVPEVMWEKLDSIDGDTEYVNVSFVAPAPQAELKAAPGPSLNPEDVLAQRGQVDADLQLALELSKHDTICGKNETESYQSLAEEEGKLMAAATEASLRTYNGIEDECKMEEVSTEATIALVPPAMIGIVDGCSTQEDSDKLIAMQIQAQMDNEDASVHLAKQLQEQDRREAAAARKASAGNARRRQTTSSSSASDKCVIS